MNSTNDQGFRSQDQDVERILFGNHFQGRPPEALSHIRVLFFGPEQWPTEPEYSRMFGLVLQHGNLVWLSMCTSQSGDITYLLAPCGLAPLSGAGYEDSMWLRNRDAINKKNARY